MTDITLSNIIQASYNALGVSNISTATAGTTLTIVDSKLASQWTNNQWKNGYAIIVRDAGGASAAPEGEYRRISAYSNSTYTFTVDTAFSVTPAVGDTYMYVDDTYPLLSMIEFVNDGLRSLDMLDLTDLTTITMAEEKTEYAGAVAWKRSIPWKIERATTSDTNDYRWKEVTDWDYNSAAAGSTPLILFKQQYGVTYTTVKIHYKDLHPILDTFSDKLREEVHPELAKWATVVKALEWRFASGEADDDTFIQQMNNAQAKLAQAMVRFPVVSSEENVTAKTIELVFNRP